MKIPQRVYEIIVELYNRNTVLARGSDDARRSLTMLMAEQVRFELGSEWGTKRADKGRPLGKDSISYFHDGELMNYDWQDGSTRKPHSPPGNMESLPTQVFVSVNSVDHLGKGSGNTGGGVGTGESGTGKPYNESYAIEFGIACNKVYEESNKPFDPGMIAVHATRASYDYYVKGQSWADSFRGHINDFRKEYGLGPV